MVVIRHVTTLSVTLYVQVKSTLNLYVQYSTVCVCVSLPPSLPPSLPLSLTPSLLTLPPSLLTLPPSDGLCHEVPESLCSASEEHLQGGQTGQRTDQEDGPRERRVTMVSTLSLTHTHTHLSISELLLANRVSKLVVGTESIFYGCCLNGFFFCIFWCYRNDSKYEIFKMHIYMY